MNYLRYKVAIQSGDTVQAFLRGSPANVLVMDDLNLQKYLSGTEFKYYGGYYTRSPVRIRPPAGTWNVVINLGASAGSVTAVVNVLRPRRRRLKR
jgi:hypothetical protein